MFYRPRGLLFWLLLIIFLFIVATAPTDFAQAVMAVYDAIKKFFIGLGEFLRALTES
ncbi:hypothetical protein ABZY36_32190 [Streptomyces sp. NPDC006627]|uniref:hypothetical protein n=1 Tax=Streptomyces sp. NPDC006627 TaxID=3154679 RepID=UPI0033A74935